MVISNDSYLYAEKYLLISQKKIHYFTPQTFSHDRDTWKDKAKNVSVELSIPKDSFILLTVSRLETEKGLADLIDAVSLAPKNTHLVVVGDGSERNQLVSRARELLLDGRVHFIGPVEHENVWKYYYASNAYVQVSKSEALGMSVLEAMNCGVPVLAFPVGGLRDSMGNNGERGLYLDKNDLGASLYDCILKITANNLDVQDMKAKARLYVEGKIKRTQSINQIFT